VWKSLGFHSLEIDMRGVDFSMHSQLAKLQIPAQVNGAATAAAAKEVTGTGKCMLWTHPANPTPTAPDQVCNVSTVRHFVIRFACLSHWLVGDCGEARCC
jgi:hypothetical protein